MCSTSFPDMSHCSWFRTRHDRPYWNHREATGATRGSPVWLLKDVVIILGCLQCCAFAADGEPLVSHRKKGLDLWRTICPLESRGFISMAVQHWHLVSDFSFSFFLKYSHYWNLIITQCQALSFYLKPTHFSVFFPVKSGTLFNSNLVFKVAFQISFLSCSVTPYSVTLFLCCLERPLLSSWPLKVLHKSALTHSLTDGWAPLAAACWEREPPKHSEEATSGAIWASASSSASVDWAAAALNYMFPWMEEWILFFSDRNMSPLVPILEPGGLVLTTKIISSKRKNCLWSSCWQLGKRGLVTLPATHFGVL